MKTKPNLYDFIESYFKGVELVGMKPLIILDTSAIIDLESVTRKQINFGYKKGHKFIDNLTYSQDTKIIIPEKIMSEVREHSCCKISGIPEISELTVKKLDEVISPLPKLISEYTDHPVNGFDSKLYLANRLFYSQKNDLSHKKKKIDVISRADWDLINNSLATVFYSSNKFDENQEKGLHKLLKGCYKTLLLSADKHIYNTINLLSEEPEFAPINDYLKPLNIREYSLETKIKD